MVSYGSSAAAATDQGGSQAVLGAEEDESRAACVLALVEAIPTCEGRARELEGEIVEGRLCLGRGHGTSDTTIEPYDDTRDAVVWVRQHAGDYAVNSARVGVLGLSAGGNLAALVGVQGTSGTTRADAVVTWSGAMHLETPNKGDATANGTNRERYIGCVYDYTPGSTDPCNNAWDAASPVHQCCTISNTEADTPFLIFNSKDELVVKSEADAMYDDLSAGDIRATKVIMDGTKHAASYKGEIIEIDTGCACDNWNSNHGFNPDGDTVRQATVNFLLAQM